MFKNLKWLRIVPDAPGKGGIKSGFHSFQAQPVNDTHEVRSVHIYRGRWRKDYASQDVASTSPDLGNYTVHALHPYVYPSLTDPSAAPGLTILGHHSSVAGQRYWDFTNNTTRDTHTGNAIPATFLNIQGRCFVADGAREGMILDDRTPAIHLQKNQNLGIGTPTQPLQNEFGNLSPYGTGYVYNGSYYISHPNPDNMIGTILSTDVISLSFPNTSYGQYAGVVPLQGTPVADAISSNTTTFTASGTVSITTGTSLVTLAGATWPANFAYCGLAINFNGYSFVIAEHGVKASPNAFDIDGVGIGLTNVQLRILGVYDGPTITGATYTITGCRVGPLGTGGDPTGLTNTSSATMLNTGTLGYSQTTASNLVQVQVLAVQGGLFRNLGNISLGPPLADEAASGVIQTITDAAMADNRPKLTSASAPFAETDVDAPIGVDQAGSGSTVLITTIKTFIDDSNVRLANSNASGGAIAGEHAWWGADPVITDGAMGAASLTLTSASNPFIPGDVGSLIVIEEGGAAGFGATRRSLFATIATYVNAGQITVTCIDPPNRVGYPAISNVRVWWRGISTSVHAGPTYSYAWYDPETGHMSNIAPLFQLPRPTQVGDYADFANVTPVFRIDPGYISYPSGVDATRFSHIMFFRTLSLPGSSTLYPIGSVMPYVGKVHPGSASTRGSWSPSTYHGWMGIPNNYASVPPETMGTAPNYWYDFSSDEDLVLTGGFRAPQFTNEKPMALIGGGLTQPAKVAYQAYWDRRLWVTSTQEPDKIAFSCDEAQCPLGIPVESFPPTNFLRIPSVDGKVLGMRTVGEMLVVTTERWAYTIAGNNESNYRLLRISTRMGGVGTYQMDELTSDVQGQPSVVYFLGKDKIVYEWVPGGNVTPISSPVQDKLNRRIRTLSDYQICRVHCVSGWARRLVVVSPSPANDQYDRFALIFDVQNRIWTYNSSDLGNGGPGALIHCPPAMSTIYGLDPPVNEIFSNEANSGGGVFVRSWLRDDGAVQDFENGTIYTFPLDFDGRKTRKQLVMVNIHVSATQNVGGGLGWLINAGVNEGGFVNVNAVPYPDTAYSVYGNAPVVPVDSPTEADLVALTAQFGVLGAPMVGYRFVINVATVITNVAPVELYAIDIGYTDWEEPGDGDP